MEILTLVYGITVFHLNCTTITQHQRKIPATTCYETDYYNGCLIVQMSL